MAHNLPKVYTINVKVNGVLHTVNVKASETLVDLLRDRLSLTGVKKSCDGTGECGACSVILDGKVVNSCLVLAVEAEGKRVLTVEGLASEEGLHPLQKAFLEYGALQCGFCTPGMIMSALALLTENSKPSLDDIKEALQGNLCRCTGHVKIIEAIHSVTTQNSGSKPHV